MSFEKFDIDRFDELLEIINGLKNNERFLSLPDFPVEKNQNTFDWNIEKIPFYNGAKIGFGFSVFLPVFATTIIHQSISAINFATLFSMVQMSFNHDNQHFLTYEEDKAITLSFITEYLTFLLKISIIRTTGLLKEARVNMWNSLKRCMICHGRMTKSRILNIPHSA